MIVGFVAAVISHRAEAAAPARAADHPLLVFRGNSVLSEEVYRAMLELPANSSATPAVALGVRRRVLSFLRRSGYDLAKVDTKVEDDQIIVDVDEGQLDKIIFPGQGAFEVLRLKLAFALPSNVFNRKTLERQLRTVAAEQGITSYRWSLVAVEEQAPSPIQIEQLELAPNLDLVPTQRPYELHIELSGHDDWGHGLAPEVVINGLEGLGLGVRYREKNLLLEDDRWETRVRVAGLFRQSLESRTNRLVLTAALLEGRWYTPPIFNERLRAFLRLQASVLNRQRSDIMIDSVYNLPLEASLNLSVAAFRYASVALGGGVEHRRLFGLTLAPGAELIPNPALEATPNQQTRLFVSMSLGATINPEAIRRDQRHGFDLEGRIYSAAAPGRKESERLQASYQKTFAIGWDEFWIKSHAALVTGDVLYPDEEPMGGDYLRGPFSGAFYVRRITALDLEFRYSLVRDLFKVSIYHDLAAFGSIDRMRDTESLSFANAFGLGLHVLIIDAFQLDTYWGVGFGAGRTDTGFVLAIREAY